MGDRTAGLQDRMRVEVANKLAEDQEFWRPLPDTTNKSVRLSLQDNRTSD